MSKTVTLVAHVRNIWSIVLHRALVEGQALPAACTVFPSGQLCMGMTEQSGSEYTQEQYVFICPLKVCDDFAYATCDVGSALCRVEAPLYLQALHIVVAKLGAQHAIVAALVLR